MAVKSAALTIAVLSVVAAYQVRTADIRVVFENRTYPVIPRLLSALLKGNRLVVVGENFEGHAVILVDGRRLKTRNDLDSPSTRLIADKAGTQIARGKVVRVQVENPGAAVSEPLEFFTGRTITVDDNSRAIKLALGEQFLLLLKGDPWDWTVTRSDQRTLIIAAGHPPIPGSQGIFRAVARGQTTLNAIGELPCHKVQPRCLAPNVSFEVKLLVE
jgi:hypothetical protein